MTIDDIPSIDNAFLLAHANIFEEIERRLKEEEGIKVLEDYHDSFNGEYKTVITIASYLGQYRQMKRDRNKLSS